GLRILAQGAAGGELDPTTFPLQIDASGNPVGQCNQFVDGFTWGSVSLATVQLTQPMNGQPGETASTPTNVTPPPTVVGLPIQIIGDPRVPSVPGTCTGVLDESTLATLMANGILGVGTTQQDCGSLCTSGTPQNVYYSCPSAPCTATNLGLALQVTNPVWVLPADNNGVLIMFQANIPSGGS